VEKSEGGGQHSRAAGVCHPLQCACLCRHMSGLCWTRVPCKAATHQGGDGAVRHGPLHVCEDVCVRGCTGFTMPALDPWGRPAMQPSLPRGWHCLLCWMNQQSRHGESHKHCPHTVERTHGTGSACRPCCVTWWPWVRVPRCDLVSGMGALVTGVGW
jgi:hypothetical protein